MTPPSFFDRFAKHYDLMTHVYMFGTYELVRKKILSMHNPDSREILDVCCGTGYVSSQLNSPRVVGIDLSTAMLAVNQTKQRDASGHALLINGDIRDLPLPKEQFDEIYFTLASHEFPDLESVLREIRRVMRPGGRLVVYDLYEPRNPLLRLFLYTFFYYIVEQRAMWVYSREGWSALLEASGWQFKSLEAPFGLSALVSAVK